MTSGCEASEMTVDESMWSREQEKAFENAIAIYSGESRERWERIAASVPGKSVEEVKRHYDALVEDIDGIESGRVPLPSYASSSSATSSDIFGDSNFGSLQISQESNSRGKSVTRSEQVRRKGIAWTEEEHRLFLLGLKKYGKGDWRSISRNFVITRTPTQVASHAQKYFIRRNAINKNQRRCSIHDITSAGNGNMSPPQAPNSGQTHGASGSSGETAKQPALPYSGPAGVGVYGPPIGRPIGGPLIPAIGTRVNLPSAGHMAYGIRAQVAGRVVLSAPMSPMSCPMPQTSSALS